MRLSRKLVETREQMVREFFRTDVSMTTKEVQRRMVEQHGRSMAAKRILELKKEVLGLSDKSTGESPTLSRVETPVTEEVQESEFSEVTTDTSVSG